MAFTARYVTTTALLGETLPFGAVTDLHSRISDICKIILAIILPPLGVFLERGCGVDLLINILLTCLGVSLSPLTKSSHSP
jgi:Uncharacterized homolog of Blt101